MNQLSDILKSAREEKGWTQEEVALKAGIKQRRYAFYESGDREPDFELLKKLVSVLDIKDVFSLVQNVPREKGSIELSEDNASFYPKGTDKEKYINVLERDRSLFEHSLRNNLNLITANLTELLKAQRYDRAQLTTLLAVTSKTLATVQNRDVETVFEETNKAVNDLIREQM